MPRAKTLLNDTVYANIETILSDIKDSDLVIKLISIRSLKKYKYEEVSEQFGVSRISLTKWVNAFVKEGIEGLKKKPKGHRPSKLEQFHLNIIEEWLTESKNIKGEQVNWSIPKLIVAIKEEFNIEISHTPLWLKVRKMNMRVKSPRPMHKQANKELQEDFKKN